ncbi:hypothetical protein J32TS6_34100 [Virgibacillus pantothenticus]|uniref:Uncharacterized protein n=1 Tax=Virgibacillus pantothenticus TaxID=1473 RepID=A0A0L0QVH8_VIRPA|nr:hypothetical protein [Virgibacillus pantothenticus]KNE22517.1 hypothetical protein AFK71_02565 [Virgibacillus pantothenticus]MED3739226.1 hypothetical protein [Virgibacillus pantothenticus]QTY16983.1 hypothetical protein KBP50_03430 [Virgibacillus pantothenticus]SIT11270.1 hypothetical protein SAMN05421787_11733 [Virgibacillus pantothenticus]GIP64855.1 hypothetical protein J32TS6_34100 [Virgibacillus pantothenticus]
MKQSFKGLVYFFLVELRRPLIIFWTILFPILIVSLAFSYYLSQIEQGPLFFSLTGPLYVFFSIWGFICIKEFIPFSIKLGATRKQIWRAIGVFFLSLAVIQAIFASIIQEVVWKLTDWVGIDAFRFLHPALFVTDNWYTRIMIDVGIFTFFFAISYLIGLVFYKYGLLGGGSLLGAILLVLLMTIATGWFAEFVGKIISDMSVIFYIQTFAVGIALYLCSFLFFRKITIVKAR